MNDSAVRGKHIKRNWFCNSVVFVVLLQTQLAPLAVCQGRVADHSGWISGELTRIQGVRPGTTREQLEKLFAFDGGLSSRKEATYVLKDCPYIKVDVRFTISEGARQNDKLRTISRPYLDWPKHD